MRTRLAPLVAAVAAGLVLLAGCSGGPTPSGEGTDRTVSGLDLSEGWDWQPQATPLELGVTHTQNTLDAADVPEADARGAAILAKSGDWQNVHLMGFGTLNPEPSPGDYDWSTLDRRMKLVQDAGAKTILTACCAPDWMKGGQAGQTDWDQLEKAPDPDQFQAYADLVAQTVQRYPQIEKVQVWNELKGFFHPEWNRWDYEGYTDLYNRVYTAVKAVRPDVQVGGPYPVMISLTRDDTNASDELTGPWGALDQRVIDALDYWFANKVGADFLVVDGGTAVREGTISGRLDDAARKFVDVDRWLQSKSNLPIWWAEFYPDVPPGQDASATSQASAAATISAVDAFARSGAAGALLWGPQEYDLQYAALWTDATEADGGQPTPLTPAWEWLVPRLAAGGMELGTSQTQPLIAFRAPDGSVLVANMSDQSVPVQGQDPIPPYGIGTAPARS
ncbi:GH39 family glycosyl hydrolase [Pseudonocardia oroxyli]|uniref:Glycosyl hydrolases family 39 n=1 Tax=Pseudonocardia oroxyli TaxID=366584 RepID=A0A1G7I5T0_PSEOR|nr:beta-galactosidase [Pseudonocardia oroxyli]SDF07794.1 Glycosyl hydrolases family 39 [Pseudonocardia oroxyli]